MSNSNSKKSEPISPEVRVKGEDAVLKLLAFFFNPSKILTQFEEYDNEGKAKRLYDSLSAKERDFVDAYSDGIFPKFFSRDIYTRPSTYRSPKDLSRELYQYGHLPTIAMFHMVDLIESQDQNGSGREKAILFNNSLLGLIREIMDREKMGYWIENYKARSQSTNGQV